MKDTSKDIIDVLIPPKVEDEENDEEIEKSETEYEETKRSRSSLLYELAHEQEERKER